MKNINKFLKVMIVMLAIAGGVLFNASEASAYAQWTAGTIVEIQRTVTSEAFTMGSFSLTADWSDVVFREVGIFENAMLLPFSVEVDGVRWNDYTFDSARQMLSVNLGNIFGGRTRTVRYLIMIMQDARPLRTQVNLDLTSNNLRPVIAPVSRNIPHPTTPTATTVLSVGGIDTISARILR